MFAQNIITQALKAPGVLGMGRSSSPSFSLDLISSLVPERALGSSTSTFTRASTAYQTDFEGKLNLVPSGAVRFQGARYVRNLVPKPEDLSTSTGGWSKNANMAEPASGAADALGGATAYTLTATGVSAQWYRNVSSVVPVGSAVIDTIWLRRRTGTGNISIYTNGIPTETVVVLTSSWQRFSVATASSVNTNNYIGVLISTSGDAVDVWRPQKEDVTGQTNQNPSEYVSVGVLSAPYHGAGVDGVAFKSTLNGNTVVDNVVVEAQGAPITSAAAEAAGGVTAGVVDASGPLGFLAEGARTNAILQSNTLGTTWTISNAADMNAVAADAYVSTDGTTTMDKLQPKATTAVHSLDQAFTFTAAKYTFALDLRYVPATPQRWVALILNDGTTTWGASFDLLNGVAGAVSAGATSTIAATALANVYRVSVTNTANAAAAAGTVKISLNATDTATLESAARAGTETLGAGMVQHEIGTFASTYIPTTTTAVTCAADVLTYPSAGNIAVLGAYSLYAETTAPLNASAGNYTIVGSNQNYAPFLRYSQTAGGIIGMFSNTGDTISSATYVLASWNTLAKVASFRDATNIGIVLNGTAAATAANGTETAEITTIYIGNSNSEAEALFGTIRNVRIYPTALSAARLQALTS